MFIDYSKLQWVGDTDGEDTEHEGVSVVGMYMLPHTNIYMDIDVEKHNVLSAWQEDYENNEAIDFTEDEFKAFIEKLKKDGVILDEL